jgi:superoxide dismutase, Cu-Zn family
MKTPASIITLAICTLAGCTTIGQVPTAKVATAVLHQANGAPAGTALLTAVGDKLTLTLAIAGLSQGQHGVHLHMVGRCDAPDFASAGGHLNPGMHQHGALNPAGSHLGDLPNLTVTQLGTGTLTVELGGTRGDTEAALFDADSAAIVIHAAADDYKTDPSGSSGARIACGVLKRS